MSELEKKLIELGYRQNKFCLGHYSRCVEWGYYLNIFLNDDNKSIKKKICEFGSHEIYFEDIEKLYNEMKHDLEELKNVED